MFQHPGSRSAFPSASAQGMDLRMWLVGQALMGLARLGLTDGHPADVIAAEAVRLADAALRRLTDAGGERP